MRNHPIRKAHKQNMKPTSKFQHQILDDESEASETVDNVYDQNELMKHVNKAFENHNEMNGMSHSDDSTDRPRMIGPLTEA